MAIEYILRDGPKDPDSPTEGACEDGQQEPVLGRKLFPGDLMPNHAMRDRRSAIGTFLFQGSGVGHRVGDAAITVSVNELFSRVCLPQVKNCLSKFTNFPLETRLFIITNESVEVISQFTSEYRPDHNINICSTEYTNTGPRLGAQLVRGDLQRTQIASVWDGNGWVVVDAKYAYDQGDPDQVPDINMAIDSIVARQEALK